MDKQSLQHIHPSDGVVFLAILVVSCMLVASLLLLVRTRRMMREYRENKEIDDAGRFKKYIDNLDSREIEIILSGRRWPKVFLLLVTIFSDRKSVV